MSNVVSLFGSKVAPVKEKPTEEEKTVIHCKKCQHRTFYIELIPSGELELKCTWCSEEVDTIFVEFNR